MNGRIAFAVAIVIVGLELAALGLWAGSRFATPGYVFMRGPWPMIALMVSGAVQGIAGLILLVRRPENRVGWSIVGYALAVCVSVLVIAATAREPDASRSELLHWSVWAGNAFLFPLASWFAFALAFIFPAGRLASPRWRLPFLAVSIATLAAAGLIAMRPGPMLFFPQIENPLALRGLVGVFEPSGTAAMWYTALPLLLLTVAGVISGSILVARYLSAAGDLRVQIRWYITSGALLAVGYAANLLALLFLGPREPAGEAIETLTFVVVSLPPIAMTLAIVRYRLYDIDVILNRAFVYGVLTALLAGLYTASIRLFNFVFTEVTGDTSDLSLVLTTLLLATTFTPIKGRLERVAARWLRPATPGPAADRVEPPAGAAPLLDDAAFTAALDARIDAALDRRLAAAAAGDGPSETRRARRAASRRLLTDR
jgi:uncharacterized membrane protein